jgi:chromosomal replication initiator protein
MNDGSTQPLPSNPHLAWARCLEEIELQVETQRFKTWFEPIKAESLEFRHDEAWLTLRLPSRFHGDWLATQYGKLLDKAVSSVLGSSGRLTYTYESLQPRIEARKVAAPKTVNGKKLIGRRVVEREGVPGRKRATPVASGASLHPKYTFDRFIVGDCNRLCASAGQAIAENPGATSFNPFFVYGGVGLGNTHLVQATANFILQHRTAASVHYVSSEQFTASFVWSVRNNQMSSFSNLYRNLDVLIVDDVQFLSGKRKTQDEFFHVFNALHQAGKQIVLSADRPPNEIDGIDEYLISRFQWGMLADIQMPDVETRRSILEQIVREQGVKVNGAVLDHIAENVKNNVRQLEGALTKVLAVAQLDKVPVDVDLSKRILVDMLGPSNQGHTIDFIADVVSSHIGIPTKDLKDRSRRRPIVFARHVAMYFAKQMSGKPLTSIGRFFGGRDHSTVLHAINSIEQQVEYDQEVRQTVAAIRRKLQAMNGI